MHHLLDVQVNGELVSGKSVGEIQQILDDCRDHLLLEVMHCRRVTPTISDISQSSSFPAPSSPLTADEFELPSVTDMSIGRKQTELVHTKVPQVLHKSDRSSAEHLNASEPNILLTRENCSHLGRGKENKPNFLDKAVNAITRPFLRSRQLRPTRDTRSKSDFVYIQNSNSIVDDFAANSCGQNVPTAAVPRRSDAATRIPKPSDSGHGTWPKYHAHGAQQPSVLPLYTVKPCSSTEDESPLLPQPMRQGIAIRRSESARHHRPQISDSTADYTSRQKIGLDVEDTPVSSVAYQSVCSADSVTALGPHYAKPFPEETSMTVHSRTPAEHQVTVISHFPVEQYSSEVGSYGGHTQCVHRPIPHTLALSSTAKQRLYLPGSVVSSPSNRSQQLSIARYVVQFLSHAIGRLVTQKLKVLVTVIWTGFKEFSEY